MKGAPGISSPSGQLTFPGLKPLVHPHYGCFQIAWSDQQILPFGPFFHDRTQFISFRFIHVPVGFLDLHPLTFCRVPHSFAGLE